MRYIDIIRIIEPDELKKTIKKILEKGIKNLECKEI